MGQSKLITVFCRNTQQYYDVPRGLTLRDIYDRLKIQMPYPCLACIVNYKLEDLDYTVYKPKDLEFVDASCATGMRCYVRTLSIVLSRAVHELFPQADLRIEHPISKGYYCVIQWPKGQEQALTRETSLAGDATVRRTTRWRQDAIQDAQQSLHPLLPYG